MSTPTKSPLKSASYIGCRIVLWALGVVPFFVMVAHRSADDAWVVRVVPRLMFMVAIGLYTVRCLGHYTNAGSVPYVIFETTTVLLAGYIALNVIWLSVERTVFLIVILYSQGLKSMKSEGLNEESTDIIHIVTTSSLASAFLIWAVVSIVFNVRKYKHSIRFLAVVEVRYILPKCHYLQGPTTRMIKAPAGPGRNPVIF